MVGATITNINIGPLLINRKGYHKNQTCFGNNLNFNISFIFNFFDCMHITNIFSQANLQVGRPKFHHNSNLDV